MEAFKDYLLKRRIIPPKQIAYYAHWVIRFFNHCGKHPGDPIEQADIDEYLKAEAKQRESWQIDQARNAVEIYRYWTVQKNASTSRRGLNASAQWKAVASEMRRVMRLRHMSYQTEKTYLQWVRRFYRFTNGIAPEKLAGDSVKDFMTHLAVVIKVSASTQNQAFNALLFMYRHVLDVDIDNIGEAVRAKRRKRLPVVLTQKETRRLLGELSGDHRLMAQIIYGGGLRLKECLNLRIQDIDIERRAIVIRGGKGDKDRETVFPDKIGAGLKAHYEKIRIMHERDRKQNIAGVALPDALERKLPQAGKEWGWFWVFPSQTLSSDPITGIIRRHHRHPSVLQKQIKAAALKAKIHKRVTVHTLRHCFATHLVENKCDIRTIQDLLGHRNLETTMIYTHVAQTNRMGIESPLDKDDTE